MGISIHYPMINLFGSARRPTPTMPGHRAARQTTGMSFPTLLKSTSRSGSACGHLSYYGPSTGLQTIFQGLHAFIAFLEKLRYLIVQAACPSRVLERCLLLWAYYWRAAHSVAVQAVQVFRSNYRWVCLFIDSQPFTSNIENFDLDRIPLLRNLLHLLRKYRNFRNVD